MLLILVTILETAEFPESISSANADSELSGVEGRYLIICPLTTTLSCQQDPVWNFEEISDVEGVIKGTCATVFHIDRFWMRFRGI